MRSIVAEFGFNTIRKVKDAVKAARGNGVPVGKDATDGLESYCG
jgi:hypothetical protein